MRVCLHHRFQWTEENNHAPGPGRYLTDYASGVIRKDGDATGITVNTVSGAVYLDRGKAELDEAAAAFLFETLGITPEIKDFSCFVMAPAQDGESTTKTFNKYFNFGIPADVKNIDAFVREPGSRPQLEVTADLRLPEDTDFLPIILRE